MLFVRQDFLSQRPSDGVAGGGRPACDELVFSQGGRCASGRVDSPWEKVRFHLPLAPGLMWDRCLLSLRYRPGPPSRHPLSSRNALHPPPSSASFSVALHASGLCPVCEQGLTRPLRSAPSISPALFLPRPHPIRARGLERAEPLMAGALSTCLPPLTWPALCAPASAPGRPSFPALSCCPVHPAAVLVAQWVPNVEPPGPCTG